MARPIQALGEIAFRTEQLEAMQAFYADVVGLEVMQRFEYVVFFKIAEGVAGHTQVLAIFDRTAAPGYTATDPHNTTVDHIAFSVALEDFEPERLRVKALGLEMMETEHAWVKWRSFYVRDPDQNLVEWVCYDPSVT